MWRASYRGMGHWRYGAVVKFDAAQRVEQTRKRTGKDLDLDSYLLGW